MALSDVIKKGTTVPVAGDLIQGGLGINVATGNVYTKNNSDVIVLIGQPSNNTNITGGSITGITDLAVADGGTGVSTLTGIVKGNGTSAFSAAVVGTDYQAPIGTISGLVKGNGANALTAAVAGTDYLAPAAIGVTVQAYDVDTAKLDVAQSWTAQQTFKELKDTVHTITDGAAFEIDPANGSVQVVTLGASRSPLATNFEEGQTVLLGVDDGTAYTVTWPSVTWVKAGGTAAAPTLATSGYTWVLLWKVSTTLYGTLVGSP